MNSKLIKISIVIFKQLLDSFKLDNIQSIIRSKIITKSLKDY